ncbi:redox-regulated ATPase YchF [Candidatus Gottesmanbacteria bacterium]|nr:redox-regulated ATPase YchF [Candidatus Gottesmanbacteria bacterium]
MNLKVGIVGLPNAGKSTLFNALLKKQVAEAANYPFTTIEPNVGVVPVPDRRLEELAIIIEITEGKKPPLVPAVVEFVDIAGLVKGASVGEGLGNKFLSHIREVDLIVNVLRFFEDPSIVHVAGDVDAERDREIIETELLLADLQTVNKQVEPRGVADKVVQTRWELVRQLKVGLDSGKPARDIISDPEERVLVRELNLLTMKPVLVVGNVSENQLINQSTNPPINQLAISAKVEAELAALTSEEQKAYLKEFGLEASGLDRLIAKAYEMLGLISFLTCGIIESRAWTIKRGTLAPQAAGVIHTDFEKKFIKADVVAFGDFITLGGWKGAREAGKARSEGKGYAMQDGDVVEFKVGS